MLLPRFSASFLLGLVLVWITHSRGQIVFEDTDERNNRSPDTECLTPERQRGSCIRWTACPSLRRISNWNRLQPYVCGFDGSEPKVCCRSQTDTQDRGSFTTTTTRRPPRRTPPTRRTTTPTPTRRPITPPPRREPVVNEMKPRFLPDNCGMTIITKTRVVGGQPAEKGAWPWMAVVFVEKRNGARSPDCGAALVTQRHVITAAHCVVTGRSATTMSPRQLTVRLGAHDLRDNNEADAIDISVDAVRRHEQFDPRTYKNDIAVLRLSRPVQFSNATSPVCLPYDSLRNEDLTGKTSTVTGFGTIAFNGPSSDVLMEASFDIQDQEYCRRAYIRELNITEEYMCAGTADGSKDSCQGDSGGPLVTVGKENRYYLVGVVSFGKLCAQPGYPGVYTRVTKYLNWLRTNLAD
ncbi:proclotting enzyme [Trichonephila inaurata madagascariensis]|uniref:CLIP domain-containing serine protease n=1 Tax=Trichonephila inaurata madagascariensis TaxID=2747483 RepID=A0A8X6YLK6_9ARAC|nr:proclotting enzyme [Trichonephila inaurata madagascariensis]